MQGAVSHESNVLCSVSAEHFQMLNILEFFQLCGFKLSSKVQHVTYELFPSHQFKKKKIQ